MSLKSRPVDHRKTITQLRLEKGLSQVDLAKCLGCLQPMVAKWESGLKPLSHARLLQITKFFGIQEDDLKLGRIDRNERYARR